MSNKRIWELDLLRGIFIIGMVMVHLGYNLDYLFGTDFYPYASFLSKLNLVFIGLCGISCTFSRNNWRRTRILVIAAVAVSLTTWIYAGEEYVRFGILHLLCACIASYELIFKRLPNWALILISATIFYLKNIVEKLETTTAWFIPLGILPDRWYSVDYVPLVPYAGFFILGIVIARIYYPERRTRIPFPPPRWLEPIIWCGRHTLIIYMLHQPILIGILEIIAKISPL